MSTKIEYLDEIWNPITGCNNTKEICPIRSKCWARDMAKRFSKLHCSIDISPYYASGDLRDEPIDFDIYQFYENRLDSPVLRRKTPKRIGVGFCGDMWNAPMVPWKF